MRVSTRFTRIVLLIAMGMTTLSLSTTGRASAQGPQRYILLGANNALPADLDALVAASGGTLLRRVDEIGVAVVESDDPAFTFAAGALPGVEAVTEEIAVEIAPAPEESAAVEDTGIEAPVAEGANPRQAEFFGRQWNLKAIDVERAWGVTPGDLHVRVAIIDTGIDYLHKELKDTGKIDLIASKSFFPEWLPAGALPIADTNRHGSHVAGIIAASGYRVAGVAPNVTIFAVKVAGHDGFAPWGTIIEGIVYAVNAGADIINMSFGEKLSKEDLKNKHLKQALHRAVNYAHGRGVLLVASAGNEAIDWDSKDLLPDGRSIRDLTKAPAQLNHVVAASATGPVGPLMTTNPDDFASYSDYGMTIVSFAAPGGTSIFENGANGGRIDPNRADDAVRSVCSGFFWQIAVVAGTPVRVFPCANPARNMIDRQWGTSMAAAHVSGVAALIDSTSGGALRADEIIALMKRGADDLGKPGRDNQYGYGRINACRAVGAPDCK